MRNRRGGSRPRLPRVTIQLDPVSWGTLQDIAARQGRSADDLVMEIAHDSLGIAIRLYIVEFLRSEDGVGGAEKPDSLPEQ